MNIQTVRETFRQLVAVTRLVPSFTGVLVRNFLAGSIENLSLDRYLRDAASLGVNRDDALDVLQSTRATSREQGRITPDEVWSDARVALVRSAEWQS